MAKAYICVTTKNASSLPILVPLSSHSPAGHPGNSMKIMTTKISTVRTNSALVTWLTLSMISNTRFHLTTGWRELSIARTIAARVITPLEPSMWARRASITSSLGEITSCSSTTRCLTAIRTELGLPRHYTQLPKSTKFMMKIDTTLKPNSFVKSHTLTQYTVRMSDRS